MSQQLDFNAVKTPEDHLWEANGLRGWLTFERLPLFPLYYYNLEQNEAQSGRAESAHNGVN